jgi:hypothetical protein
LPGSLIRAQQENTVSATVTIGVVSVQITPTSFNYGNMPFNGVKESYDKINFQRNNNINATVSVVETDLYIKGANTESWTLADLPGENQFVHRYGLATNATSRPSNYNLLTTSNKILKLNVQPGESVWFGLEINTPTSGNTSLQSAGIIITAFDST